MSRKQHREKIPLLPRLHLSRVFELMSSNMAKCQLEIMATSTLSLLLKIFHEARRYTRWRKKDQRTIIRMRTRSQQAFPEQTARDILSGRIIHSRDVEFNDRTPAAPFVEPGTSNDISARDTLPPCRLRNRGKSRRPRRTSNTSAIKLLKRISEGDKGALSTFHPRRFWWFY